MDKKMVGTPEWTNYVLNELSGDEVWEVDNKKLPTVHGLRRIVRKWFKVMTSRTEVVNVQYKTECEIPTVTVIHHLYVEEQAGFPLSVTGTACVGPHNVGRNKDGSLFAYPGEFAETRAEGRSYIRLLGLNVCTKEEIVSEVKLNKSEPDDIVKPIHLKQLETICSRLDIDVAAVLSESSTGVTHENLTVKVYTKMFKYLSELCTAFNNGTLTKEQEKYMLKMRGKPFNKNWR